MQAMQNDDDDDDDDGGDDDDDDGDDDNEDDDDDDIYVLNQLLRCLSPMRTAVSPRFALDPRWLHDHMVPNTKPTSREGSCTDEGLPVRQSVMVSLEPCEA
ncbi:hypothetical protein ACOMHN_058014 [Nucella lapillus]